MASNVIDLAKREEQTEILLPPKLTPQEKEEFFGNLIAAIQRGQTLNDVLGHMTEYKLWQHFSDADVMEYFLNTAKGFYRAEFMIESLGYLASIIKDETKSHEEKMEAIREQAKILGFANKAAKVVIDQSDRRKQNQTNANTMYVSKSRNAPDGS